MPANYPSHLEQEIVLPGGDVVWLRPVVPDDASVLAAEFAEADEDTLYMRFFNPTFALTDERLRYFTQLDYESHVALAVMTEAGEGSEGMAIARYVARSTTDVECAVVVKPEYRKRGIARVLLIRLAAIAATVGYQTMSASYLEENAAAGRLLESCGFLPKSTEAGVVEMSRSVQSDSSTTRAV
ncbi:MAG: GNAT family N-acetyltransferase [bacterium]|nr:GNAT family N-acetyltransferase [bacterium]